VGRKGLASLLKPLAGMVSIRVGWPSPEAILTWSPRGDVACDEATATSRRGTGYVAVSQVTKRGHNATWMWYLGAVAPDANETCACMRPAQRYSVWSPTNKVAWACAARGGHASDMESHIPDHVWWARRSTRPARGSILLLVQAWTKCRRKPDRSLGECLVRGLVLCGVCTPCANTRRVK
jgi:hypothetical protein